MNDSEKRPPNPPGPAKADKRAERLAAALRANLARRKAQARSRATEVPQKPDKSG